MYYYHHQNNAYHHRHHPYQNPSYRRHQNPSYYLHQNPSYHHHHHQNPSYYDQNPSYNRHHPYQNPSYCRHQNPSYYLHQNPSYHHHHHQNPSYYDQNPSYHRHQSLSYHRHHHQSPSYYDQNPSYYHRNYAYPRRRQHQHHHQNPSYDRITHHHHRNHFYDQNLSYYHHHQQQQQQHRRNRFYDQIEALHCAAPNPTTITTRLPVAEVKPKPKAPVVVVDFPLDALILILARLPAKTLLKFRCVCKSWNSLIQQDRHFLSLHQLHLNDNKKPPPLVTLFVTFRSPLGEGLDCVLNYSSSSSSDTTPYKFDFTRLQQDPLYCITNSCNGLLGVYSCYSFFIVNPTIRKLRPLATTWAAQGLLPQAALGFDASTGVYKVLRIFEREHERLMPLGFGCEVYGLGGSGGWRLIDDPPVQPSYVSLPVAVDGSIIWASETVWKKHLEVVALSFDLREEKFSVILHPEGSSRRTCSNSHVFTSGGHICVADEITSPVTSAHMNIWLLLKDGKKNNSDKWVKQYVVDLTYVFKQMGLFCTAQPLTTDHNGRIVISWGRGRKDYYDPRTGSFDKHELDAHADVEYVAPYAESIVWPWPRLYGVQ